MQLMQHTSRRQLKQTAKDIKHTGRVRSDPNSNLKKWGAISGHDGDAKKIEVARLSRIVQQKLRTDVHEPTFYDSGVCEIK